MGAAIWGGTRGKRGGARESWGVELQRVSGDGDGRVWGDKTMKGRL